MNKKILFAAIITATVCVSGWNISRNKSEPTLSDMALENVEALAESEWCSTCSACNVDGIYVCFSQWDNFWSDAYRNCQGGAFTITWIMNC